MPGSLYARDYYAWTREQAARLREAGRSGNEAPIDWERVAEEIEDIGDSKWDEVESRLGLLIAHLLKVAYCRGRKASELKEWWLVIREHRRTIAKRLRRSPSLRPLLADAFGTLYQEAREVAADQADVEMSCFPADPPFTLEQALDPAYLIDLAPDYLRPTK